MKQLTCAALLLACALRGEAPVTVYWNEEKQPIDGFGASCAWRGTQVRDMEEPARTELLDALFSAENGIGLSIVRGRVNHRQMPESGEFVEEPDNNDAWLLKEAQARGAEKIWLSAWTPPAWMKTNNDTKNGGKLKPGNYSGFADLFVNLTLEFRDTHGIELYALSPANEPLLAPGYDSCLWTGEELRDFVRDYLAPALKTAGLAPKLMLAEDETWDDFLVVSALADPETEALIDIIAAHQYKGDIRVLPVAEKFEKALWQTEVAELNNLDDSITDALRWARNIHDFLTIAEVNAWHYWWITTDWDDSRQFNQSLLRITSRGSFAKPKRFFTIGQYSRYIRPDFVRLATDAGEPFPGVLVTAFKEAAAERFVVVAVNDTEKNREMRFTLDGFSAEEIKPVRTSATEDLEELESIACSENGFTAMLAPFSVTTFAGCRQMTGAEVFFPSASFHDESWMKSGWLGAAYVNVYPWIWTARHGWWWCGPGDENSAWIWDLEKGWLWTARTVYPYAYRWNRRNWVPLWRQ